MNARGIERILQEEQSEAEVQSALDEYISESILGRLKTGRTEQEAEEAINRFIEIRRDINNYIDMHLQKEV